MIVRRSAITCFVAALVACGTDPIRNEPPAKDAEVEAAVDAPAPAARGRWPGRPPGEPKASGRGGTVWAAAFRYRLGSLDDDGRPDPEAWRTLGYDLDRRCTTAAASEEGAGTCRRAEGSSSDVLVDGADCRDNNFGQHVIPLVKIASADFEEALDRNVQAGGSTWILRLDDVDPGDDPHVPGKLYIASKQLDPAPDWQGKDLRKIQADSLRDADLERPIADFPRGYVADGIWVSGEPTALDLVLPFSTETTVTLGLDGAVITVALDPSRRSLGRGAVAGAMRVARMEEFLRPIADRAKICPGSSLYESTRKTLARLPDLVADAPDQQDEARECDAISVGLGLEFRPIEAVTEVADPPPEKPGRCQEGD
jgi:hypothetical protein